MSSRDNTGSKACATTSLSLCTPRRFLKDRGPRAASFVELCSRFGETPRRVSAQQTRVSAPRIPSAALNAMFAAKPRCATLLLLLLVCNVAALAQATHPTTGREIAPVMGVGGAPWLVRPERVDEEAPDAALDAIALKKGDVVADIGAGVGYFTWRMAERVGPEGKVYANDIQPRMLEQLRKNIATRGLTNVILSY